MEREKEKIKKKALKQKMRIKKEQKKRRNNKKSRFGWMKKTGKKMVKGFNDLRSDSDSDPPMRKA